MPNPMTGTRKSAIVLLALEPKHVDQVLRRLPNDCVKMVTREIAAARAVSAEEREQALSDFMQSVAPMAPVSDAAARDPRAASAAASGSTGPFADFRDAETTELLDSIRDEHPQTVALVLAHLPPNKASDVLAGLPSPKQVEVVKRIASIEQISSDVIDQVERGLRQRLGHIMGRTVRSGGVGAVAEILNSADRKVERDILDTLQSDAPQLADQIRRVQAIFEDLLHARDEDLRAVLDQLDVETIALSLRTARERLKRKVLRSLPANEARQIEREILSVAPVRISEIEQAQHRVAEVVNRLEQGGEIRVTGAAAPARRRRHGGPPLPQPAPARGDKEGA